MRHGLEALLGVPFASDIVPRGRGQLQLQVRIRQCR